MTAAPTLSMQLYSGRNFPPVDDQLAAVQRAGFTAVETFGPFYDDLQGTLRRFGQHGLSARSGHFSIAMAEQEPERVLQAARALGMEFVVIPYLPPPDRPTDRAGWVSVGQRLAAIGARFGTEGLRVAWHNHDFEFTPLPDGSLPIEHVLGDAMLWEADLAWVVRGGADPKRWLARYAGRTPLVHIKDIARAGECADEDGWADVGAGVLPWAELWPLSLAAGAEVMIAEHDNPSDFARFAQVSADAMRGYAKGAAR